MNDGNLTSIHPLYYYKCCRTFVFGIAFCFVAMSLDLGATPHGFSHDYENGRAADDLIIEKILGVYVARRHTLYLIRNDNRIINHRFDESKMNSDGTWVESVPVHFLDFTDAKLTYGRAEDLVYLYEIRTTCRFSGVDGEKKAAELMAKTLAAIRIKYNFTQNVPLRHGDGDVKEYYKIEVVYDGMAAYDMAYEPHPLNPILYITHKVEHENGERFDVVVLKFVEWSRWVRTKKWWKAHVEEVARKKKEEADKKALREKQFQDAGLKPEDLRGL